mmetsp:Transcript_102786/g.257850  ORF Transcript_102786/g.257850 Transcript_102786/m.257850 type:complete len:871 (+) Transcript_102786:78-2690(+)
MEKRGAPKSKAKAKAKGKAGIQKAATFKEVDDVVEQLFRMSDVDKSGAIEFDEFLIHHRSIMSSTDFSGAGEMNDAHLEVQFRAHDKDNNLTLDKQEFRSYMDGVFSILGKRKFLDICHALVEDTVARKESQQQAFDGPSSARLVEKAMGVNRFLPDIQQWARQLLEARADPNFVDCTGSHTLLYAADKSDDLFIADLLKARANPALHNKEMDCAAFRAARSRSISVLNLLLLPEAKPSTDSPEKEKLSQDLVRNMASLCGPDVSAMIKKGAEINFRDDNGWTPLTSAVFWGKNDCLEQLLKTQTSHSKVKLHMDARNARGRAAIHIAARKGRTEMITPLIKARTDVDLQDSDGWTALHHAVFNSCDGCIVSLLENSANMQVQGVNGFTPVMLTKMPQTVGGLPEKVQKMLDLPENLNFGKALLPALKDDNLSVFEKLDQLLECRGVHRLPVNLRLYEQYFDCRHGPNKVRLQKFWEALVMPIICRLYTGETDLESAPATWDEEARAERAAEIAFRMKEQKTFLLQWLRDSRGPRRCCDWKFDNREVYAEEMKTIITETLDKFRVRLDELYEKTKGLPCGEDLVSRPQEEVLNKACSSQLQVHPLLHWLQQLDPTGAFEALRHVGAAGLGRDDEDSALLFVDLIATNPDFEDGKAFWRNIYRLWLVAYAKMANAEFQKRVSGLVEKFNNANVDDEGLSARFRGAEPKSYEQIKVKEAKSGTSAHDTYQSRTVASKVMDIVRCSITVSCPRAAIKLLDEVFKPLSVRENKLEVLRIENGFSSSADMEASMGYRNIQLSILMDAGFRPTACGRKDSTINLQIIGEVQILLQDFLDVRKQRHLIFKAARGEFDWTEEMPPRKDSGLDDDDAPS